MLGSKGNANVIRHLSFVVSHLSLNTRNYPPRLQLRANLNPMCLPKKTIQPLAERRPLHPDRVAQNLLRRLCRMGIWQREVRTRV
jgi:hypothetical protein